MDGEEVSVDRLRKRKEFCTAYLLLMIGWTGAHHFYLDRLVHGMFALWSLNFFGLGWFLDALLMPLYVRGANRGTSPVASSDSSACHLIFRLPLVLIVGLGGIYGGLFYTPSVVQAMGLIDLEVRGANTTRNPFDILQAPRGASADLAKKLYDAKVRNVKAQFADVCNEECEFELEESKRAYNYITGKAWRRSTDEARAARARRKDRKKKKVKRGHEDDDDEPDVWDDFVDQTLHNWRVMLTDGLTSVRDKVVPEEPSSSFEDSDDGDFGASDNEEL